MGKSEVEIYENSIVAALLGLVQVTALLLGIVFAFIGWVWFEWDVVLKVLGTCVGVIFSMGVIHIVLKAFIKKV